MEMGNSEPSLRRLSSSPRQPLSRDIAREKQRSGPVSIGARRRDHLHIDRIAIQPEVFALDQGDFRLFFEKPPHLLFDPLAPVGMNEIPYTSSHQIFRSLRTQEFRSGAIYQGKLSSTLDIDGIERHLEKTAEAILAVAQGPVPRTQIALSPH